MVGEALAEEVSIFNNSRPDLEYLYPDNSVREAIPGEVMNFDVKGIEWLQFGIMAEKFYFLKIGNCIGMIKGEPKASLLLAHSDGKIYCVPSEEKLPFVSPLCNQRVSH